MGLQQTKKFFTAKEIINKMKREPTEWENTFTNDISDMELISKIYVQLIQLNTKTHPPQQSSLKMGKEPWPGG